MLIIFVSFLFYLTFFAYTLCFTVISAYFIDFTIFYYVFVFLTMGLLCFTVILRHEAPQASLSESKHTKYIRIYLLRATYWRRALLLFTTLVLSVWPRCALVEILLLYSFSLIKLSMNSSFTLQPVFKTIRND